MGNEIKQGTVTHSGSTKTLTGCSRIIGYDHVWSPALADAKYVAKTTKYGSLLDPQTWGDPEFFCGGSVRRAQPAKKLAGHWKRKGCTLRVLAKVHTLKIAWGSEIAHMVEDGMHMKLWDSDGFCRSACTRLESVFHNLAQNALSGKIFALWWVSMVYVSHVNAVSIEGLFCWNQIQESIHKVTRGPFGKEIKSKSKEILRKSSAKWWHPKLHRYEHSWLWNALLTERK
jgi:hypothetical protein